MNKRAKEKGTGTLAAALPGIIRDKGWEKQVDLYSLFVRWPTIVDRTTARHARPLKIVRNVFWVEVDNSAWIQQLQYLKKQILDDLNALLTITQLKDVKFVLPQEYPAPARKATNKVRFNPVDQKELEKFEAQAGAIEDKASREALIRLWYLSQTCRAVEEPQATPQRAKKS